MCGSECASGEFGGENRVREKIEMVNSPEASLWNSW